MRIVSQQSDHELAKRQLEERIERLSRVMAANILRVVRGAGKPLHIFEHSEALLKLSHEYFDIARIWPVDVISTAMGDWRVAVEDSDGLRDAKEQIAGGALQLVASELIGQRTQAAAGSAEMHRGIKDREQWIRERGQPRPRGRKRQSSS